MSSSPAFNNDLWSSSDHYDTEMSSRPARGKSAGLTAKLLQTINTVSGRQSRQSNNQPTQNNSMADFTHLSTQSQELLLRTVDAMKKEDSENVIDTLDQSRNLLRDSYEEFKREQEEYRKQLEDIIKQKQATIQRPKENTIPLSLLLKQKRDVEGLADLRPNSSINPTYQAYFEALLQPDHNQQQHPSDKAAVVKYIRRRERRRRAEQNKEAHQLTHDALEQQTADLLNKMENIDMKLEHERQRQNDLLRVRMNEKKIKSNNLLQASELLDQANEADLIRQRVEQSQRDKVEARLSAIRQQTRSPSNLIHVQPRSQLDVDDDHEESENEEVKQVTKASIQRLNDEVGYRSRTPNSATVANIEI